MIPKPKACEGCPLYGDGQGFIPDEIIPGARVLILTTAGQTGDLLNTQFLPLAGLERGKSVSIASVLKCRGELSSLSQEARVHAITQCTGYLRIPDEVTHIVLYGELPLNYAVQSGPPLKVTQWRGHVLQDHRFLPRQAYVTESLALVGRDPKLWWISELDWRKIDLWVPGYWPKPIPQYLVYDETTWREGESWFTHAQSAPYIVIDTEYVGGGHPSKPGYLTLIGIGYQSHTGEVHGIQADYTTLDEALQNRFSALLRLLIQRTPTVFQNFAADMPVLKKYCGIPYNEYKYIHDTMLSHAVLYCELPHSLEFQASIYGQYPKLKHLSETNNALYNWGDVIETIAMREGHIRGFLSDKQAESVYVNQSLSLIPVLLKSMESGIRINKTRVLQAKEEYTHNVQQALALAHVYLGWPINLGSDEQVKWYCYQEQKYPVQLDSETGQPTVSQDAIATLRDLLGPEVIQGKDQEDLTIERALERIAAGGDPVLEARTLYMEYQHILDAYIYAFHVSVVNARTKPERDRARKRVKFGATGATGTTGVTVWGHDDIVTRTYPTFAIHAQKNARWSTSDPPLAQLPKALRSVLCPDPGHLWFHWDWKGIELHFLEVHSGSEVLKAAHEQNMDIHTWTACVMFGYEFPTNLIDPHKSVEAESWRKKYAWLGKDDPRRVFAKSARYEMNYGGQGNTAADKAIRMGLSKDQVKLALSRLLTADIHYFKWRTKTEDTVKRTRVLRTFMGRPRRFMGVGKSSTKVPPKVVREALDYTMQGGVSDVFNTVVVQIGRAYPFTSFSWGMHDSQYHSIPVDRVTKELFNGLKNIVQQEFTIEGKQKSFPADFEIITADSQHYTPEEYCMAFGIT